MIKVDCTDRAHVHRSCCAAAICAGKNRVHDRYIQRDYEKFKRLDAQLEQEKTAVEPPARHNTRRPCHETG